MKRKIKQKKNNNKNHNKNKQLLKYNRKHITPFLEKNKQTYKTIYKKRRSIKNIKKIRKKIKQIKQSKYDATNKNIYAPKVAN